MPGGAGPPVPPPAAAAAAAAAFFAAFLAAFLASFCAAVLAGLLPAPPLLFPPPPPPPPLVFSDCLRWRALMFLARVDSLHDSQPPGISAVAELLELPLEEPSSSKERPPAMAVS